MNKKISILLAILVVFVGIISILAYKYPLVRWQIHSWGIATGFISPVQFSLCGGDLPISTPITFDRAETVISCDFEIKEPGFYKIDIGYSKEGSLADRQKVLQIAGGRATPNSSGLAPIIRGGPMHISYALVSRGTNEEIFSREKSNPTISSADGDYFYAKITTEKLGTGRYTLTVKNLIDVPEMSNIKSHILINKYEKIK